MKCEGRQCWHLVTASNNLQHQEEQNEFQPSDVFLICADGFVLKGARKTRHQCSCLRCFSHRFAVCCNLVRFMSHSKSWNKSRKFQFHSSLCSIGVCSAACSSTAAVHSCDVSPLHDESSLCENISLEIGSVLFSIWLTTAFLPARNVTKERRGMRTRNANQEFNLNEYSHLEFQTYVKDGKSTVVLKSYRELTSCSASMKPCV